MPEENLTGLSSAETDVLLEYVARLSPQWLAGFFDGEGCVYGGLIRGYPYITVTIPQKTAGILAIIALKFPTRLVYCQTNKNHVLQYSGRKAIPILEFMKDFAIIKKKEIELGLELANLLSHSRSNEERERLNETFARRLEIVEELRLLKDR
jgi:hypothetical protein